MNVHSYCKDKVANLCGINQKLLAEALSQVSQVCTATHWFFLSQFITTKDNLHSLFFHLSEIFEEV